MTIYRDALEERKVRCPYCDEPMSVTIDLSEPRQDYIEDCQICCRPIEFAVSVAMEGDVDVVVSREDG